MTDTERMGQLILNYEARRDSQGRLAVYDLPAGDGGGTYEVAGINDKYHPQEAGKLAALIRAGSYDEAEREAAEFMVRYTNAVQDWSDVPAIEFFLRDCCFNRGARGAGTILQLAVGADVDGRVGPKTREALDKADDEPAALLKALRDAREQYERNTFPWKSHARDESSQFWQGLVNRWDKAATDAATFPLEHLVWRQPDDTEPVGAIGSDAHAKWPRQRDVEAFYGAPGSNQVMLQTPFPLRLAWDTSTEVHRFSCHAKCHDAFDAIWKAVLEHYGYDEIKLLRLDLYGGCLNVRKMRGGSRYSMHSWGIAFDVDPDRNSLHTHKPAALLSHPEYDPFWKIVYGQGALSLGRERDYDWMHFQFTRDFS